jgi:hypothetical protein
MLGLRIYPALLLYYAGGVAAAAAKQIATINELLTRPRLLSGPDGDPFGVVIFDAMRLPGGTFTEGHTFSLPNFLSPLRGSLL